MADSEVKYPIITDDTGRAIAGALQAMAHGSGWRSVWMNR